MADAGAQRTPARPIGRRSRLGWHRNTGAVNHASGDFEGFVSAQWDELYAVAAITLGDPDAGARVTATALVALTDRWAELTSAGSPTAAARTAVMTAALTAARRAQSPVSTGTRAEDDGHEHGADLGTATRGALAVVLAEAPATARAALAAARWWHETPALVAACAKTDSAPVEGELADLERALTQAHAAVVGRHPHEPFWSLPDALADVLDHTADDASTTDPVARVAAARSTARRRRTRRGVLAVAAALTAAATALAWPSAPSGGAPTLPLDAKQWSDLNSWPARGSLAADSAVTRIAAEQGADPGAHLLFAGTLGDTVAMVMSATQDPATYPAFGPDDGQPRLRLWTAPASGGTAALAPTRIVGEETARAPDVVALSIDQRAVGAAPAILVMTRPTIASATIVTGALPQSDGSILPHVRELPLTNGVGSYLAESGAFIPRLAVSSFLGPPAGVGPDRAQLPGHGPATELAAAQRTLLAAVTGRPADTMRTPTALESVVEMTGVELDGTADSPSPVQVTVVTTITPDGGWVRTTRLSSTAQDFALAYLERLATVPSSDHTHALLPSPAVGTTTFVALGPDAATAVLVTTDGQVRDTATITNGIAVLTSTKDPPTTTFRLRLLAPDGHTVYDAIPPTSDELLT